MTADRRQPGRRRLGAALAATSLAVTAALAGGCGGGALKGTSDSFIMVVALQAASGASPQTLGGNLASDVRTFVKRSDATGTQTLVPTVFADVGQVTFKLGLKDPGTQDNPNKPTTTNYITVNRYHVDYIRSDGRSVQGVDVPYSFDGAMTLTVTDVGGVATFTLVREQSKEEAPLLALIGGGGQTTISTIAQVTFYGSDQSGRPVSVTAQISVNFSDWGDPS